MVATPTFAAQFTIQTKRRMDSRLHSKNLNSPLVSSGLICYRTIKHVTTLPPGVWCVTGTSSTAYATPGCSHPHTALRDTPSQTQDSHFMSTHSKGAQSYAEPESFSFPSAPGQQASSVSYLATRPPHPSRC